MRILVIRGENLASLGEPFLLDFEAEPLASTGLFAITGETGSGKSTILDALCLALYGRYPRFAEQQQDLSPDPGGRVKILDGSTILRRGSGQGHAEVDFLGHDNQRYRVRWEARRSRGRADGAIQNAARSLYSLSGATATAMATSKTEVQDAIHRLTGLTFEQFCRTVLLAQGEFDSFLLAPERERGDLLEKITGTEIYGRISRRVREGTKLLELEVEALETQLTNLGLLSLADHDALAEALAELRRSIASKSTQTAELQQRLSSVDQLLNARTNLATAADLLVAAKTAWDSAAPDRALAAELAAVEALRSPRERLAEATKAVPIAEGLAEQAAGRLQTATTAANQAASQLSLAQAEHDKAEKIFKDFGPQWDEAAGLDTDLGHAKNEADGASRSLIAAKATLNALEVELERFVAEIATSSEELANTREKLANHSDWSILADRLQEIRGLLDQHRHLSVETDGTAEHLAQANKNAKELGESASQLETKLRADAENLQTSESESESLRQQLDAHDQVALEAELQSHTGLLELLHEVQALAASHQAASDNHGRAEGELLTAQAAKGDADESLAKASGGLAQANEQRAALIPLAELAEESLAQRTAHLRSQLLDGEPCPVCGALEHPYLKPGAVDALSALAASLKARREELDQSIEHLTNLVQQSAQSKAAAQGTLTNSLRQIEETKQDRERTQDAYAARTVALAELSTRIGLEAPPEELGDGVIDRLGELESSCRTARVALSSRLTVVRELSTRHDKARRAWEQARKKLDQEQGNLHGIKSKANDAHIAAVSLAGTAELARQQVTSIEEQVRPFLAAAGLLLADLRSDRNAISRALEEAAAELLTLRTQEAELSRRMMQLGSDRARTSALLNDAAERQSRAVAEHAERLATFRKTQETRALLLGGELTTSHRTRINDARKEALKVLGETQTANSTAASVLVRAQASDRQTMEAVTKSRAEEVAVSGSYLAACLGAGFSIERADGLLGISPSVGTELRDRMAALDLSRHTATARYEGRQADVDHLRSDDLEAEDREALALALSTSREEEAALNQELGEKGARLQKNLELRRTAAELQEQAQTKGGELVDWRDVDNAIGSPNGDRFRLFAQSLTLEQLIQLANVHLDTFSKRYHLARSPASDLALHVTDRDMGDEERPTRSLSGGERFLVSLSLALALSGLEGHDFAVDTLFIDEGFGSLDLNTLDIATSALETLHSRGRKVGVITHVAAMIESIPVQVKVETLGGGSSVVRVVGAPDFPP
jgi:DNA repair protein SbcC/Rad50